MPTSHLTGDRPDTTIENPPARASETRQKPAKPRKRARFSTSALTTREVPSRTEEIPSESTAQDGQVIDRRESSQTTLTQIDFVKPTSRRGCKRASPGLSELRETDDASSADAGARTGRRRPESRRVSAPAKICKRSFRVLSAEDDDTLTQMGYVKALPRDVPVDTQHAATGGMVGAGVSAQGSPVERLAQELGEGVGAPARGAPGTDANDKPATATATVAYGARIKSEPGQEPAPLNCVPVHQGLATSGRRSSAAAPLTTAANLADPTPGTVAETASGARSPPYQHAYAEHKGTTVARPAIPAGGQGADSRITEGVNDRTPTSILSDRNESHTSGTREPMRGVPPVPASSAEHTEPYIPDSQGEDDGEEEDLLTRFANLPSPARRRERAQNERIPRSIRGRQERLPDDSKASQDKAPSAVAINRKRQPQQQQPPSSGTVSRDMRVTDAAEPTCMYARKHEDPVWDPSSSDLREIDTQRLRQLFPSSPVLGGQDPPATWSRGGSPESDQEGIPTQSQSVRRASQQLHLQQSRPSRVLTDQDEQTATAMARDLATQVGASAVSTQTGEAVQSGQLHFQPDQQHPSSPPLRVDVASQPDSQPTPRAARRAWMSEHASPCEAMSSGDSGVPLATGASVLVAATASNAEADCASLSGAALLQSSSQAWPRAPFEIDGLIWDGNTHVRVSQLLDGRASTVPSQPRSIN